MVQAEARPSPGAGLRQVLYREKDSDPQPRVWLVEGNASLSVQLTGLGKYVLYEVQVLAFTRIGDGSPSRPPILERTLDDGECPPAPTPPGSPSVPGRSRSLGVTSPPGGDADDRWRLWKGGRTTRTVWHLISLSLTLALSGTNVSTRDFAPIRLRQGRLGVEVRGREGLDFPVCQRERRIGPPGMHPCGKGRRTGPLPPPCPHTRTHRRPPTHICGLQTGVQEEAQTPLCMESDVINQANELLN